MKNGEKENPKKEGEQLEQIYTEKRKKHIHGLIQDIEIQREEYILLGLIYISIGCIISLTLDLSIFLINSSLLGGPEAHSIGLIMGLFLGILFAGFSIDYIQKKLTLIQYLMILETINLIIQINYLTYDASSSFFNFLTFALTGFSLAMITLLFTDIFLEYSCILERGRIYSYLIIETIVFVIIISVLSHIGIKLFPILLYTPLIFNILTVFYINREKQLEQPLFKTENPWEEKHLNPTVIKYCFFIFFFSFTVGLATPISEIDAILTEALQVQTVTPEVLLFLIVLIISASLTALLVGLIFDFFGRLMTISSIIVIISFATIFLFLQVPLLHFNEAIIISSYLAVLMSLSLLMGDVSKRKNYGKVLTLAFTICISGIFLGLALKKYIPQWTGSTLNSNLIIISILYLSSVISLAILVNSKETLPHKEKEWYESLEHIYVIHKTGILLYDYDFNPHEEKIEADLVSGGIIGLTTLLKEIVKGQEKLRTIDHGDMKLMFKYSSKGDVIFVLVIREDLIILRDKLDEFSSEFIGKYEHQLKNMEYVNTKDWIEVSELVDSHFERKYFDFAKPLMK